MNILNDYINALWRSAFWIVMVSVIGATLAYMIVNRSGVRHEVHYSYLVSLKEREQVPDYRFDGYYALQATDLFSSTLAALVTAPETVVSAIESAQVTLPSLNPFALKSLVQAEKQAPQFVHVVVKHRDKEVAEKITKGLQTVIEKQVADYHDQGTPAVSFRVVGTEAWVAVEEPNALLVATIVFIVLLFIGANGVLFIQSLKRLDV